MRDLSSLARDSMWITSQEAGNMVHDNTPAMTAPGSAPATPVPKAEQQADPTADTGTERPVGTQSPRRPSSFSATPVTWKAVSGG